MKYEFQHAGDPLVSNTVIDDLVSFLHRHLDEFGDEPSAIRKAIDHALGVTGVSGGFILMIREDIELVGALVMNRTGMSEFIPENVLVYVAVHRDHRGKGIGGELVKRALEAAKGDVKLHVEYNNPARHLYERIGFTSKYAEMRYIQRR